MSRAARIWERLRILLIELLVGTSLGVLVWEAFGRRLLSFKYGSLGSSVTCAPDVDRALADFDSGLRTSAIVGAVAFAMLALVARIWLGRRRAKRQVSPQ